MNKKKNQKPAASDAALAGAAVTTTTTVALNPPRTRSSVKKEPPLPPPPPLADATDLKSEPPDFKSEPPDPDPDPDLTTSPPAAKKPRAAGRRAASATTAVSVAFAPPPDWRTTYAQLAAYRAAHPAPVDTMGCGLPDPDAAATPAEQRYATLVSLQLSSQTRDEATAAAVGRLRAATAAAGGKLTPAAVAALPDAQLTALLRGVSFHVRKTTYLKATARMLIERYAGDIPRDLDGLLELPGVGPKMAYLALQCAWGDNAGIGVDTHVHRISQRLGWAAAEKGRPGGNPQGE
ncbi:DNA glycosylase [Zopfochytrium polystomum]|nr:DNA glycosylase [Zopfochytrium polystomum]